MGNRVADEAVARFDAWAADREASPLHASLRAPVWRAAVRREGARAVEVLQREWRTTTSIDGKLLCLQALSATEDADMLRRAVVPFNLDAVPAADIHALAAGLGDNPAARPLQWEHLKRTWAACRAKMSNPIVMDRFIRVALGGFTDARSVDDLDAFFADKDTSAFNRTLATVRDKIRARAAYKARDAAALREWLGANGYL